VLKERQSQCKQESKHKKEEKNYKISKWVFIFEESVRNETEDSRIFHCDILSNT
jgi:hypothetical protein